MPVSNSASELSSIRFEWLLTFLQVVEGSSYKEIGAVVGVDATNISRRLSNIEDSFCAGLYTKGAKVENVDPVFLDIATAVILELVDLMKDLDTLSEIDNSETVLKLSVRDFQIFNELYQSSGRKIAAHNLNISQATIHRAINNIENAFISPNLFGVRGSNTPSAMTRRIYESSSKIVRLLEDFVPVMRVVYNHPDFEKLTTIELLRASEIFYRSQLSALSLAKQRWAVEKRSKLEKQDKIAEADSNIHFCQERLELASRWLDNICARSPIITTVPS